MTRTSVLWMVGIGLGACGRPAASSSPAPSASIATSSSPATSTSTTSPSTSTATSTNVQPMAFEVAAKQLQARCTPKKPAENNLEMKEQMHEDAQCRRTAMVVALDETLVPLKTRDLPRFQALMALQAQWNRYEDDACWLAEEAFWVDFDAGTRDDGTARSTPTMGCEIGMRTERWFFARALAAGSAESIARRARDLAAAGARTAREVDDMRVAAARLAKTPPPSDAGTSLPMPLDAPARRELAERVAAVASAPAKLADATCAAWPELEQALGGGAGCRDALALYYAGHTDYDQKP